MKIFTYLFLTLLLCLGLTACSTPETRSKEKMDTFSRLSKDQQRLVLQGRITEGISEDAVYIAMGHPNKVRRGRYQGKDNVAWVYGRLESYVIPRYRIRHYRAPDGCLHAERVYEPETHYRTVETFSVFFDGGKVVGWQEL
jgi:hypothetical protein